jgi:ketosteroid isomerase-like protein
MAGANFEDMRRAYEAIARGDFDAALGIVDPEIVIRDRPESPDASTYHGYDGMRKALELNEETFDELVLRPERFFEAGDQVVVVLWMVGRGKHSGAPVEERIAHLFTIRDGVATSLQVYSDPNEALAAAGISERVSLH